MRTLVVDKRDLTKTTSALRRAGVIPGIVYGPHQEPLSIGVEARAFEKVFRDAGEASVVSLTGLGKELPVLVHEVDLDPITHMPRHIDFYAITKGEKVEVAIPLEYVNESPAVKAGANLIKVLHELEIKADPMNLPQEIAVDISVLVNVGDQIHVSDLSIPAGVELMIDETEVVALIQAVEEEKAEEAPADLSAIEVEKKGKEEAEGEEAKAE